MVPLFEHLQSKCYFMRAAARYLKQQILNFSIKNSTEP